MLSRVVGALYLYSYAGWYWIVLWRWLVILCDPLFAVLE